MEQFRGYQQVAAVDPSGGKKDSRMSIKYKIILSYIVVAIIIGALGGFAFYHDINTAETVAVREASTIAKIFSELVVSGKEHFVFPDKLLNGPELQEHVEQFKRIQNRDIAIVDRNRVVLADAVPEEIGKEFNHDPNNEVAQTLKDGRMRLFTEISDPYPQGIKLMVLPLDVKPGDRIGALIMEYTPLYSEIVGKARDNANKFLLLYLGGLVLSLSVGYIVSRQISRPILAINEAAIKVASGELDVTIQHQSTDELGTLSRNFNRMTENLKISHDELLRSHEELETESIMRTMSEKALLQSEQKLWTIFEFASDAFFILDQQGNFIDANRTSYERLGYTKEDLLSRHVSQLNPPEFASKVHERMAQLAQQGWAIFESAHVRADGTVMPVEVNARTMQMGERKVVFSSIRDITERKLAEKELQKYRESLENLVEERTRELSRANEQLRKEMVERERMESELHKAQRIESLGILAGGIAHDFNNLLTTMLANISMAMLDLGQSHPAYKQLAGAERASLRAQELTQQLLTFSRGGAPIKRTTAIRDLVRESAVFALRGTRIRCEFDMPEDLWLVDADEGQISQVIHNLMINADQAMPDGGTITVSCENMFLTAGDVSTLGPGPFVKITVRDRGVGIAKEHLQRIFDPYFTTKQRGSGLGLATSYSIVHKHGGSITVESELGAGTTFIIFLPASPFATRETIKQDAKLIPGTGKILIMDDEEEVRQTAGDALGRLGYTVVFAEDGDQAIVLYTDAQHVGEPFDAVIMDLTIQGGMGGQEAVRRLLAIDPDVKAIVSSGYSNDPVMASYRSHGFAGVVAKPYRIRELGAAVAAVIRTDAAKKA